MNIYRFNYIKDGIKATVQFQAKSRKEADEKFKQITVADEVMSVLINDEVVEENK